MQWFPSLRKDPLFITLITLFLLLRLLLLFFGIEPFTYREEFYRGTIAKELREGLKFPFIEYRADDYQGGSLVVGSLAVPFFFLFGPNLISLKLVGLLFSLGSFILLYYFCKRYFSQRTTMITCVVYFSSAHPSSHNFPLSAWDFIQSRSSLHWHPLFSCIPYCLRIEAVYSNLSFQVSS